jgi:hypothetical protein
MGSNIHLFFEKGEVAKLKPIVLKVCPVNDNGYSYCQAPKLPEHIQGACFLEWVKNILKIDYSIHIMSMAWANMIAAEIIKKYKVTRAWGCNGFIEKKDFPKEFASAFDHMVKYSQNQREAKEWRAIEAIYQRAAADLITGK